MKVRGEWLPWAASLAPPARWGAPDPVLAGVPVWKEVAPGVEWSDITLQGGNALWRVRIILVRVDPAAVEFRLVVPPRREDGYAGRWQVDEAPSEAIVAVNAGQFTSGPWGWLVVDGVPRQPAGFGVLAPGVAVGPGGAVAIVPQDSLVMAAGVTLGFQSYPALLMGDGDVPLNLRQPGQGVDLTHRDSRLALGLLRDGRVLLALTRFEGLGGLLEVVPFGPTTPEMALVMGSLGCRRAVLLDGGISGQLMVSAPGGRRVWPGLRRVAAGLLVFPRRVASPGTGPSPPAG